MQKFQEIQPGEITGNPFTLIGKDWMLVTAGDAGKFNTMTASWGGVGVQFCGAHSGRDVDKVQATGLTPVFSDGGVYFEEAKLVLVCRKLAYQDMDPAGFIDPSLEKNYAAGDYHRMYAAEIVKAYQK